MKESPTCFDIYSVTSKEVEDFFKFYGLLRKPKLYLLNWYLLVASIEIEKPHWLYGLRATIL